MYGTSYIVCKEKTFSWHKETYLRKNYISQCVISHLMVVRYLVMKSTFLTEKLPLAKTNLTITPHENVSSVVSTNEDNLHYGFEKDHFMFVSVALVFWN